MKVYAKRLNDKEGDKLPVITVRQPKATGVLLTWKLIAILRYLSPVSTTRVDGPS